MPLGNHRPGPANAAEFSVSPVPWVTSSIATGVKSHVFGDALLSGSWAATNYVTKWVIIRNVDTGSLPLRVAFTNRGLTTSNNFFTLGAGESFSADLRLASIFMSGSSTPYEMVAGLTGILSRDLLKLTGSNGFPAVG